MPPPSNNSQPFLVGSNLFQAKKLLFFITKFLDRHNIPYHLEGGTLLGIVRDRNLLPWDNDTDISIPIEQASKLAKLKISLLLKGYQLSIRKSEKTIGPIEFGQYSLFKVKPLFDYILCVFYPPHKKHLIVLDIFVKTKNDTSTFWQAKGKVMRVENKYYESYDTIEFENYILKTPNHFREYLTEKYGNWNLPVKNWDCSLNELTLLNDSH